VQQPLLGKLGRALILACKNRTCAIASAWPRCDCDADHYDGNATQVAGGSGAGRPCTATEAVRGMYSSIGARTRSASAISARSLRTFSSPCMRVRSHGRPQCGLRRPRIWYVHSAAHARAQRESMRMTARRWTCVGKLAQSLSARVAVFMRRCGWALKRLEVQAWPRGR